MSIMRSLLGSGSRRRSQNLEALQSSLLEQLQRLHERVEELHRKVDAWAEREGTAVLLKRLEEAERRRRELGDQAAHLIELLGDARRGLALAEKAARQARKQG